MKSALRNANHLFFATRSLLNPRLPHSRLLVVRLPCSTLSSFGMASGESPALHSSPSVEDQFKEFRNQLEESGSLRERIRMVVNDIESTSRLIQASLLLLHQSRPVPEVLEDAKTQIEVLRERYNQLAEIVRGCPGQYYRYHGDWRSETQTVVSLLAFRYWLESGNLLLHSQAQEELGLNNSDFNLDIEDYLIGICFMSNEMPRYVVNRVTAGDYDCPRKVLKFLTDLHAAFRMLNLRNDFLRKKFDGLKYDLQGLKKCTMMLRYEAWQPVEIQCKSKMQKKVNHS